MDTRKLFTRLVFLFLATSPFAQFSGIAQTNALIINSDQQLNTAEKVWNDITIYKNVYGKPVIQWTCETEKALEFLLQGSTNGKSFRSIKRIKADALLADTKNYEATDESGKGYLHFRIICVDANGNFFYSKVVSVKD